YQVRGERGADPTEPAASGPYPFPAVRHEPRMQLLHDDFLRQGLQPFPVPLGVRLNESNGGARRSPCIRCNTCDGFPCLIGAKSDAQTLCIDPTLDQWPNATLRTGARVTRVMTDSTGREATGVMLETGETLTADVVVLSAGAINSAALLLKS